MIERINIISTVTQYIQCSEDFFLLQGTKMKIRVQIWWGFSNINDDTDGKIILIRDRY